MRHRYRIWLVVFAAFFVAVGLTIFRGDGRQPISITPNAHANEDPANEDPANEDPANEDPANEDPAGGDSQSPSAERHD